MKDSELARVLVLVGAIDRKVPTEEEIRVELPAWRLMAEEGHWESFEAVQRAVAVYRTEHPDFPLRPGHITQTLERVRRSASASYTPPTDGEIPDHVLADPAAYQRFMREAVAQHQAEVMAGFAGGKTRLAIEASS